MAYRHHPTHPTIPLRGLPPPPGQHPARRICGACRATDRDPQAARPCHPMPKGAPVPAASPQEPTDSSDDGEWGGEAAEP